MNKFKLTTLVFLSLFLFSCGDNSSTGDDISSVQNMLEDKFGDEAYYTEISITYNESIGYITNVITTNSPESLMMEQWTNSMDNWTQTSEITIEIPKGTKAADFMFQIGEEINLNKLSELVEKSKQSLTSDKQIENPRLHMAFIKYPDTGEVNKAEYIVMLQPEFGGTTFTYSYKLNGELIEMDY